MIERGNIGSTIASELAHSRNANARNNPGVRDRHIARAQVLATLDVADAIRELAHEVSLTERRRRRAGRLL